MNYPISVAIAVCTYRRPELLEKILGDLGRLTFSKVPTPAVSIYVIDNDQAESARFVAESFEKNCPFPVVYFVQAKKGLSSVRNSAIQCANESDFLAFVDDDERVDCSWLDELLNAAIQLGSQFAIGPVRPVFPDHCSGFFKDSRLFHRQEFCDHEIIHDGNTGNALVDIRFIRQNEIKFNPEFESSGGEDTCFFSDIKKAGGSGVYALKAVAEEPVAPERLSIYWLIRRRCRFGSTEAIQAKIGRATVAKVVFRYASVGILRMVTSLVLTTVTLPFSRGRALKYACAGARGFGYFIGAIGLNVKEY